MLKNATLKKKNKNEENKNEKEREKEQKGRQQLFDKWERIQRNIRELRKDMWEEIDELVKEEMQEDTVAFTRKKKELSNRLNLN